MVPTNDDPLARWARLGLKAMTCEGHHAATASALPGSGLSGSDLRLTCRAFCSEAPTGTRVAWEQSEIRAGGQEAR